ncbi:MAG: hypothetical protein ACREQV_17120, partial [Candidatus Binatia bacterium]
TKIRTSIMELMQELTNLTHDDNLVIGTMKSIFGSYKVRLAGAPVDVRLVGSANLPRIFKKRNGGISLRFV